MLRVKNFLFKNIKYIFITLITIFLSFILSYYLFTSIRINWELLIELSLKGLAIGLLCILIALISDFFYKKHESDILLFICLVFGFLGYFMISISFVKLIINFAATIWLIIAASFILSCLLQFVIAFLFKKSYTWGVKIFGVKLLKIDWQFYLLIASIPTFFTLLFCLIPNNRVSKHKSQFNDYQEKWHLLKEADKIEKLKNIEKELLDHKKYACDTLRYHKN
jgi:hypothetical protein